MLFTLEDHNTKLAKSTGTGYYSIGLFLHPGKDNSKGINLCPFASQECLDLCLNTSGLAAIFKNIRKARKRKTEDYLANRQNFYQKMVRDIAKCRRKAEKLGKQLTVRLNGTSDIDYPSFIFNTFPNVVYYDYTKSIYRIRKHAQGKLPKNYHLTFSYSGENIEECREVLSLGYNVAVVFDSDKWPETFLNYPVINGEASDLRFLDQSPCIVGLKAKGEAKKVQSNFVIQIDRKEK
jgi:hypothetical protein